MSGTKSILLIDNAQSHHWHKMLREVMTSLGTLEVVEEDEAVQLVMSRRFDLIVVDAAVRNVPLLVARIRAQNPGGSVVVASADPSWLKAREAFHAGASDYIGKTLDRTETLISIRAALKKADCGK